MNKITLLIIGVLAVTVGCQPAPTPTPPIAVPSPTSTAIPPTSTPIPPPTLTLTIKENVCTLDGPTTIPHSVLTINLMMDEQKQTESGYALITLKEGKTIEDLQAYPSAIQPDWVNLIHGVHEFVNGLHTYTYNYANVAADQTLYLVCFRADPDTGAIAKIAAFGPIEVK